MHAATDAGPTAATRPHGTGSCASRLTAYVSPPRPAHVSSTPAQSSGGGAIAGTAGTSRTATAKAMIPSGRLTRNSHRQLAYVVMKPPASGAITGAIRAGHTMYEIIRIRSDFAVVPRTASLPTGVIIAAPAPCNTRQATSAPKLVLVEHSTDAPVKTTIDARNTL